MAKAQIVYKALFYFLLLSYFVGFRLQIRWKRPFKITYESSDWLLFVGCVLISVGIVVIYYAGTEVEK